MSSIVDKKICMYCCSDKHVISNCDKLNKAKKDDEEQKKLMQERIKSGYTPKYKYLTDEEVHGSLRKYGIRPDHPFNDPFDDPLLKYE